MIERGGGRGVRESIYAVPFCLRTFKTMKHDALLTGLLKEAFLIGKFGVLPFFTCLLSDR